MNPVSFFLDTDEWVKSKSKWIDPHDGFDYKKAIRAQKVPPTLFLTGANDKVLGNPKDVKVFMEEIKSSHNKFELLSTENGNLHNYDHINICTHPDSKKDHFLRILEWFGD